MIETILTFSVGVIGSVDVDIIQYRLPEDPHPIASFRFSSLLCINLEECSSDKLFFFLFQRRCEVALLRLLLKRLETSVL